MQTNNPFAADGVELALAGVGSAETLIQLYANLVIQQPTITLTSVPSFAADQQTAATAAQAALNQGQPLLIAASADARGFANQFGAMSAQLSALAQTLDNPATSAAAWADAAGAMSAGAALLIDKAATAQRRADDGAADLTTLASALRVAGVALAADQAVAQQVLGEGEIKALRAQLATIQNAIDADNRTLAGGATDGALASVKVSLAVIQTYYDGPAAGVETLVGAIQGIAQSDQTQHAAMKDLDQQIAAYQAVFTQLAVDAQALAIVTNEAIDLDLLIAHAQEATLSLETARDAWSALVTKMRNLQQALLGPPSAALGLTASVDAAARGWSATLALVDRIQGLATLPVVKEDP